MEKKKYEKPIVLDFNGNAASGDPLACMTGTGVAHPGCGGGGLDAACYAGTGGATWSGDCRNGTSAGPGTASCLSGTSALYECSAGTGPQFSRPLCAAGTSA